MQTRVIGNLKGFSGPTILVKTDKGFLIKNVPVISRILGWPESIDGLTPVMQEQKGYSDVICNYFVISTAPKQLAHTDQDIVDVYPSTDKGIIISYSEVAQGTTQQEAIDNLESFLVQDK